MDEAVVTLTPSLVTYMGHAIEAKKRLTQVRDLISSASSTRQNIFSMDSVGSDRRKD
jgi:hypothetical protein